ncbi:unnamed protein product [Chrysoparadoxa australica]
MMHLLLAIACFMASFRVGEDLGEILPGGRTLSRMHATRLVMLSATAVYATLIGLVIGDNSSTERTGWWVAGLLAPIGALTRYGLGKLLNKNTFPWGTLAANLTGSLALGLVTFDDDSWKAPLETGVTSGILSSLTTMSTFISEEVKLRKTSRKASYGYLTSSVVLAQVIMWMTSLQ